MTLAGIEPATFRFVAQHLNHCAESTRNKNTEGIVCIDTLLFFMFRMWLQKQFRNFA